jgi:hypothetical protein
MTSTEFRRFALSLPATVEAAHMGHPDFRVAGKIFATLAYPTREWGVVMLTPDDQEFFVNAKPGAFTPAPGAWGRAGSTQVKLRVAPNGMVRAALIAAWRRRAPRKLAAAHDQER